MVISKKIEESMNDQINKELFSEYLYLSMAAHCYHENLEGFGNFFKAQAKEEHEHAMKFFKFINERRGKVTLKAIAEPKAKFDSILQIFEETLAHEEFITKSIHSLMDLAVKENDHASASFLKWYVDEQVEEEANMDAILQKLKLANGNINIIMMLDAKLGERK
ncbi:MAG: ferritin [Spirochaetes bacterium GWB1_36_13]|nr:MAG: ferritin [Spirochaetes bacterium GWB1_36_13]